MSARGILAPARPSNRKGWLWLGAIFLIALIIFMPLRLALGLAGVADNGVSARGAGGTVWNGQVADVQLGSLTIGTLDIGLHPTSLLLGRLRFDGSRVDGVPITGSAELGWGSRAVYNLTGILNGGRLGDVPVEQLNMEAFTAVFANGRCIEASGRVQLVLAVNLAGTPLPAGLSGAARCDDGAVLLPLASDTGVERLFLRIEGDGRYSGSLGTGAATPMLRVEGRL